MSPRIERVGCAHCAALRFFPERQQIIKKLVGINSRKINLRIAHPVCIFIASLFVVVVDDVMLVVPAPPLALQNKHTQSAVVVSSSENCN